LKTRSTTKEEIMTPVSWVHEWWQEDCSTDWDEGEQVCRKIAEIDALWRMSYEEKADGDRLEQPFSGDIALAA
jgi:hypothetical protein